jgi:hypothetical protein
MARPWVSEPGPFSAGPSFFKSHVVTEKRYYEIHFVEKLRTALIFCRIRETFPPKYSHTYTREFNDFKQKLYFTYQLTSLHDIEVTHHLLTSQPLCSGRK